MAINPALTRRNARIDGANKLDTYCKISSIPLTFGVKLNHKCRIWTRYISANMPGIGSVLYFAAVLQWHWLDLMIITSTSFERRGVSNHRQADCLIDSLFGLTTKNRRLALLPYVRRCLLKMDRNMMTSSNRNNFPVLALCAGNSPVISEFPTQRPVTRIFDVFFYLLPNKLLSKQSRGWWFEAPWRSLWRHSDYQWLVEQPRRMSVNDLSHRELLI